MNPKGIYDEAMSSFFRNIDGKTGRDLDPIVNINNNNTTFLKQHKISDLRARVSKNFKIIIEFKHYNNI